MSISGTPDPATSHESELSPTGLQGSLGHAASSWALDEKETGLASTQQHLPHQPSFPEAWEMLPSESMDTSRHNACASVVK